jgi:hypothetical protein
MKPKSRAVPTPKRATNRIRRLERENWVLRLRLKAIIGMVSDFCKHADDHATADEFVRKCREAGL